MPRRAGVRPYSTGDRRSHPKLTYANVTSTLALFLALAGTSAFAATYLVTSVAQIKPSVRAALRSPVLHTYDGSDTYLPNPKNNTPKLVTFTTLTVPAHTAALVTAKVDLYFTGTVGDTVEDGTCFLVASSSLYDEAWFGGPAGDSSTVPLELSLPAQSNATPVKVECETQNVTGSDAIRASWIQEDATALQ